MSFHACKLSTSNTGYERSEISQYLGGPNPQLGRWAQKASVNGRTLTSVGLEKLDGPKFQRAVIQVPCVTPAGDLY